MKKQFAAFVFAAAVLVAPSAQLSAQSNTMPQDKKNDTMSKSGDTMSGDHMGGMDHKDGKMSHGKKSKKGKSSDTMATDTH